VRRGKSIFFPRLLSHEYLDSRANLHATLLIKFLQFPVLHIHIASNLQLTISSHTKAECPNEAVAREFTGTCRLCEQQGHRAFGCPNKPPEICKNCQEEGHGPFECKNPRKIDRSKLPDVEPAACWVLIKEAVAERDMEDVKDAIQIFLKSVPETTYAELEKAFRTQSISIYLICVEKELQPTFTNSKCIPSLQSQNYFSCSISYPVFFSELAIKLS
jgi:hypothetical protein